MQDAVFVKFGDCGGWTAGDQAKGNAQQALDAVIDSRKLNQRMEKVVAYYRVSTKEQGVSGLGIEGQRADVARVVESRGFEVVGEYEEVESGKNNDRPKLAAAIQKCADHDATLIIAKLDRLARNAAFIMGLQDKKVRFIACDMPGANEFTVGIMALVAQNEAKAISDRTKKALEARKARGLPLGRAGGFKHSPETKAKISASKKRGAESYDQGVVRYAVKSKAEGLTLQEIADFINDTLQVKSPRGKKFSPSLVAKMLKAANQQSEKGFLE